MLFNPVSRRRLLCAAVFGSAALALAGCMETASDFNANAPPRARAPDVPVALVSLEGAPEPVTARLSSAIARQASRRDIQIVGIDGKPRYQVRGYLAAHPLAEGKAELSWAFDIFDAQHKRAKRFSGEEIISRGQDWSAVSDQQLQIVAFKALDEIAEFLAATPEAVAARSAAPAASAARRAASLLAGH